MSWKEIVGSVAPLLGTALGGPVGGMAGKFLADKLGVPVEDLEGVVGGADAETMVAIKNADIDFKVKMRELGLKEKHLHQKDRDSARGLAKLKGIAVQAILTAVFLTGYFSLIYLFFKDGSMVSQLDDWSKGQLGILIGILTAAVPQILAFWFGSSEGSKKKTEIIGRE